MAGTGSHSSQIFVSGRDRKPLQSDLCLWQGQEAIPVRPLSVAAVSLRSLHKKNIYHQNLRPENILLSTRDVAFISDFGAACLLSEGCDKVDTWTAAPGFRGPEADKEDGQLCPFQLDTYSLAVSMWQVLSGLCPVKNKPLDHLDNIPPQYAALLRNLLLPDPDMRWTLDKFLTEALELHPDLSCFL
ncbi:CBL-interacting protein kinase 24-like [Aplysia californica]|uniref:CBL-interacting protein kinase 24-like n=1 Tax=Aplysia californica TaxID=6500 RepID=A0ABM0K0P0_APLCA|nr:CBL-interacting protein kinase 24-like [Aplysia californica]